METQRQSLILVVVLLGAGFLMLFAFIFVLMMAFMGVEADFATEDGVGIVELNGEIRDEKEFLDNFHELAMDEEVKAIVIRVNSPGGAVGPSQAMYTEIMKTRERKPVVATMGSIAASGGYYVSCAADYIFSNPGTLTGSIGVIIVSSYIKELLKTLKLEMRVYKSGKYKDSLSPFRKPNKHDEALIKALIEDTYEQFLDDIVKARKIDKEALKRIADGRVLTGKQAFEAKLVDELGNFYDAVEYAAERAGLEPDPRLIYPRKKAITYIEKFLESAVTGIGNALDARARTSIDSRMEP